MSSLSSIFQRTSHIARDARKANFKTLIALFTSAARIVASGTVLADPGNGKGNDKGQGQGQGQGKGQPQHGHGQDNAGG